MSKKKATKKARKNGTGGPEYVLEQLHPFCVELTSLTPDPDNARIHNDRNIDSIMASLQSFKQRIPIVATADGVIEKGNGTYEAARRLGWKYIAAVRVADNEVTKKAFSIADNRTGELAEWDFENLASDLQFLQDADFDVELTGWLQHEVDPLVDEDWTPEDGGGSTDLPFDSGGGQDKTSPILLTETQRESVEKGVEKMRTLFGKKSMSEGRAMMLLCDAFVEDRLPKPVKVAKKKKGGKKKDA